MKKFFKILALIFVIVLFVGTIVFLARKTKKEPEVYNIEKPQKTNIVNQTMGPISTAEQTGRHSPNPV